MKHNFGHISRIYMHIMTRSICNVSDYKGVTFKYSFLVDCWRFALYWVHCSRCWSRVQTDADHWVNTIDILAHCSCSAHVCPSDVVPKSLSTLLQSHQHASIKFPSWLRECLLITMTGSMSSTSQRACISPVICWTIQLCNHHMLSIDQVSKLAWKVWGRLLHCILMGLTRVTWLGW